MGKGEIARYEQFLLFPQCFQKASGASKGVIVWEWVNTFTNKPEFFTLGKGEFALNEQFFYSQNVFYPLGELSAIFIKLKSCHLQTITVWKNLKFVIWERVNPLPDDEILEWSKLRQSADNNFEFDVNSRKFSKLVKNTVKNIARHEQFLLFPQCFQKACFPGASKGVIVWDWVNTVCT